MSLRLKWLRMQQRSGWPFGPRVTILWIFGAPFLIVGIGHALNMLVQAVLDFGVKF